MTTPLADKNWDSHAPQPAELRAGAAIRSAIASAEREEAIWQIAKEHAMLRRLFDEVSAAIRPGGNLASVPELMRRLAAELATHFQLEEVNGIFEQIANEAPHLAREVAKLCLEHAEFTTDAAKLVALAKGDDTPWAMRFGLLFGRFRDRVAYHEAEEDSLIQRAYCVDHGTMD